MTHTNRTVTLGLVITTKTLRDMPAIPVFTPRIPGPNHPADAPVAIGVTEYRADRRRDVPAVASEVVYASSSLPGARRCSFPQSGRHAAMTKGGTRDVN
jgi:hypothetical protein